MKKEQNSNISQSQILNIADVRQRALLWWNKQSKNRKYLLYQNYCFKIGLQNNSIHNVKGDEIDAMYLSLHVA